MDLNASIESSLVMESVDSIISKMDKVILEGKELGEILRTVVIAARFYERKMRLIEPYSLQFIIIQKIERLIFSINFCDISVMCQKKDRKSEIIVLIKLVIKAISNYRISAFINFTGVLNYNGTTQSDILWIAIKACKNNIYSRMMEIRSLIGEKFVCRNHPNFYVEIDAMGDSFIEITKRNFTPLSPVENLSQRYEEVCHQILEWETRVIPIQVRKLRVKNILKCKTTSQLLDILKSNLKIIKRIRKFSSQMMNSSLLMITVSIQRTISMENKHSMTTRNANQKSDTNQQLVEIIGKLLVALPVLDMFSSIDDDSIKLHFLDIAHSLEILKRSCACDNISDYITNLRYLRLRIRGIEITHRSGSDSGILTIDGSRKRILIVDNIKYESAITWRKKFQKLPTLQSAMSLYDENCVVCCNVLAESPDVAIFGQCDHILCLKCAQRWFSPTVMGKG